MGMGSGWSGGFGSHHMPPDARELARGERLDGSIVRRALAAFRPYLWPCAGVVALLVVTSVLGVLPPLLTRQIIDRGILARDFPLVLRYTLLILGVGAVSGLLGVAQNYLSNLVGQQVMADFRQRLFEHLHTQPLRFFTTTRSGELVSRVVNDVGAIQTVVTTTLVSLISNVLIIATTVGVMFAANWRLTVLALVVVPAFVAPTQRVGRVRQELQRRIQQNLAGMTGQLAETLGISGALLVKAFAGERREAERFAARNVELRDLQVRQGLAGRWLFMWIGLFTAVGPALLYGYGGWLFIHHRIQLGTIVAFVALIGRLYGPLGQLVQLHVNVLTSVALFRRIFGVLDRESEVRDGVTVLVPAAVLGWVAFERVVFRYESGGEPVLRGVDLEVPSGRLVALVGPSGAGKTTLMHLVPRFYDPSGGRVTLDGADLRGLRLASLRAQTGLVPQEPFLLHDTVRTNLLYARPDASEADLEAACRAAQIHEVILALPQGYDTLVGERGYRLSGGEKQRLAIARVLLRAPRIVLLDEATSSLDTLAERQVQSALEHLLDGRTALVIAHRLSTVLAADQIVVLRDGRVEAVGRHRELLAAGGLYAQLYREQFDVQPPAQAAALTGD